MAYDNGMQKLSDREIAEETLGRLRRVETKTTKVANHLGVDAGGDKPELNDVTGVLQVPSRKVSLDDVLDAVRGRDGIVSIAVYCGTEFLMTFRR